MLPLQVLLDNVQEIHSQSPVLREMLLHLYVGHSHKHTVSFPSLYYITFLKVSFTFQYAILVTIIDCNNLVGNYFFKGKFYLQACSRSQYPF